MKKRDEYYRIILCGYRWKARKEYRDLLLSFRAYNIEIKEYADEDRLLEDLEKGRILPDVVYLDISGIFTSGMQTARKLRGLNRICEIILLNDNDHDMIPAFDINAFHYIIKDKCPQEHFEQIFGSVMEKVAENRKNYICPGNGGQTQQLKVFDIWYMKVVQRIVTVYYGVTSLEFYAAIHDLEDELADYGFIRVHRAYLVPLVQIERLSYEEITLRNGMKIPVGRKYYRNVKSAMQDKYGI